MAGEPDWFETKKSETEIADIINEYKLTSIFEGDFKIKCKCDDVVKLLKIARLLQ